MSDQLDVYRADMPVDVVIARLEAHGCTPKRSGSEWRARCPAHDDKNPSLGVREGKEGRALVYCQAGCSLDAIRAELDLSLADLFVGNGRPAELEHPYDYTDEDGHLLYQSVRSFPKKFRLRSPDGDGWVWNVNGVRRVPYRLPRLIQGVQSGERVFVVEGEKDADLLHALGLVATTNAGGAGKWEQSWGSYFTGASVVVIPDNDDAGLKHARQVMACLAEHAADVKLLELPGVPEHGDVSDWLLAHDDDVAGLLALVEAVQEPNAPELFTWERAPDPFVIPPLEWLVQGLWCALTHGELAGAEKTLKSYIGLILDVGLAAGVPVLGRFDVAAPKRVLHLAGEGGRAGYWRRFGRVCAAYGVDVGDVRPNLEITFDTAPLNSSRFAQSVRPKLDSFGPVLTHVDPYYAFAPTSTESGVLTSVGPALEVVRVLCAEFDTSLLLNNHFNQTGSGNGLTRITGAGHSEWSDSWLLVHHRQSPDVAAGRFRLRLDVGSRQWGGTSWDLDLDIGRFNELTGQHDGTIKWNIDAASVDPSTDPQSAHDAKVAQAKLDLLKVARRKRQPFTKSKLIDETSGTNTVKRAAFDQLVDMGSLVGVGTTPVPWGKNGTKQVPVFVVAPGLLVAP